MDFSIFTNKPDIRLIALLQKIPFISHSLDKGQQNTRPSFCQRLRKWVRIAGKIDLPACAL